MTCATAATFCQGMGPLALGPQFPFYIEAFHSDLTAVVQFTGVAILVLGFSNFIWSVLGVLSVRLADPKLGELYYLHSGWCTAICLPYHYAADDVPDLPTLDLHPFRIVRLVFSLCCFF